ncbi:MAG: hypothetical protein ACRDJC_14260 [Thermomicrobiales bacterium]
MMRLIIAAIALSTTLVGLSGGVVALAQSGPVDVDIASGASNGEELFGIHTAPLVWDDVSTQGGDSTAEAS